jgi:Helix-turn-helix domain
MPSIVLLPSICDGVGKERQMDDTTSSTAAYSIADVMARVPIGRDSIYKAIREKRLIARKNGKRTIILASDLGTFLRALPQMGGEAA